MKFLIGIIYLISLFSFVHGQSETETPTPSPTPKAEKQPPETQEETTENEPKTEVQINSNYEVLTKDLGSWSSITFNVRHNFSRRQVLYGFYQKVQRATVNSDTATVGLYQPLNKKFTLLVETSMSPTHTFLPKWSGLFQLETRVTPTAFVNAGYRRTIYKQANVNIISGGVEKYWGAYRFTYNAYLAQTKNATASFSNRVQVDRYYGRHSSNFGADFSIGNEIVNIFTQGDVLKSNFTSFGIGGKHWFNKRFGVNYRASFYQQGDFYNRGGSSLGAIFRF